MFPLYSKSPDHIDLFYRKSGYIPPSLHHQVEIVYVLEGTLELGLQSKEYHMQEGDLALIFPEQIHYAQILDYSKMCGSLYLLAPQQLTGVYQEIFRNYVPYCPLIRARFLDEDIHRTMRALFCNRTGEQHNAERFATSAATPLLQVSMFQMLLKRTLPLLHLTDRKKPSCRELTARTSVYLAEHFQENITLSSLAKALYVSPYTASRIISSDLQTNLHGYLNDIRIEYVCTMLCRTDKSITEISEDAGFVSLRTFNRAFRKRMRMSPREFRCTSCVLPLSRV